MVELDHRSVCRKTGVSPKAEMDIVIRVELECSYGAGDGRTRSGIVSMPKERSGGPRLDRGCDWEKYGYDSDADGHCHGVTMMMMHDSNMFKPKLAGSAQSAAELLK